MFCCKGWLESVGSRVVYELDYTKPILYAIPIQTILGKLPVVPVGDTGTIQYHLRNTFSGAPGDCRLGAGDGCKMWFVNSWALGWSRDMKWILRGRSARQRMKKCSMWPRCIAMFGPCYRLLCMCCTDSACFFRECIADINFGPNVRLRIVLVADLRGVKDGTWRRFWRGVSQKGGAHTIELSQYFCYNTWPLYVRMLSAC